MGRRTALATLACGAALLVGCSTENGDAATSTASVLVPVPQTALEGAASSTAITAPAELVPLPDACALLLPDEAVALAGTALDPPIQSDGMCTYTGPVTGPLAQVEVYVGPGALKILEIDRDELVHVFTSVAGVGDESTAEDGAIFVRVGTTWLALRFVTLDDPAAIADRLQTAARIAASRLPSDQPD